MFTSIRLLAIAIISDDNIRKTFRLNRLLMEYCFFGNFDENLVVHHIDENKTNNNINNIEIVTQSTNVKESLWKSKGNKKTVHKYSLDNEFICEYESTADASKDTGIKSSAIQNCAGGKSKISGGFIWKYVEESKIHLDLDDEIFVKIINEDEDLDFPYYEISNLGNVKSKGDRFLSQNINNGYPSVYLYKKEKSIRINVHRLVALFFVEGRTAKKMLLIILMKIEQIAKQ